MHRQVVIRIRPPLPREYQVCRVPSVSDSCMELLAQKLKYLTHTELLLMITCRDTNQYDIALILHPSCI